MIIKWMNQKKDIHFCCIKMFQNGWHSLFFDIHDSFVLEAIACHTTLKSSPNDYEMILFLADKMAWDQQGIPPYLDTIIQALDVSLEYACYRYIDYLFQNDLLLCPHHLIEEAYANMKEKYD